MNDNMIGDFEGLLAVERTKLNDQVKREIGKTTAQFSARGSLQSSMAIKGVVDVASRTIPIFAQATLNLIIRSTTAHGIAINSTNRDEIRTLVAGHVSNEVARLRAIVSEAPPLKSKSMAPTGETLLAELGRIEKLEMQRITGELALIAASNDKRIADGVSNNSPTLVFNAPVGVVQTGPGSYGIANQVIDSAAREALENAFTALLEVLAAEESEDVPFDRLEVEELAIEGKSELSKEKPNRTRLKTIVSGIGGAISYAPKFKDAYDTLKWAGALVGISLP
ncbi:hypothetical protein [Allomesorhizobium alhagi]|uniref:Uncharacterized protein n=1 Tax=Mesorhizobium alhagi CCNWXJ12-2 TaxID=1107882 RepID=H0HM80_9HYPH|nr:hypothetical protein [Mesorhizobium alhagi]EHK58165.1 hypothetical protein MAXJ12_06218 [Mesorhizobium alhagi CCNWXJ12-2]